MKAIHLINLVLVCQLLQTSLAVERKSSAALETLTRAFSNVTRRNHRFIKTYLKEEIYAKRYTQSQLNTTSEVKAALIHGFFPGYMKNETDSNDFICVENMTMELPLSDFENVTSYFNGFLLKCDDVWYMRKVENDRITYSKVEGRNVMELLEFLFGSGRYLYKPMQVQFRVERLLALIQVKYQLEEDIGKTGRSMAGFEEEFWREFDLGSDLVQKVLRLILGRAADGSLEEQDVSIYGACGQALLVETIPNLSEEQKESFGDLRYVDLLNNHYHNLVSDMRLNEVTEDQKVFESDIRTATANEYLKKDDGVEGEEAGALDSENSIKKDAVEEKKVYRRSADDVSIEIKGRFLILF